MNRLVRGSVILAAAAVSWACGGLDTDGIDQTARLVADPSVVFVSNTDSQAVFVEAQNELGQQLEGDFTVTDVGAGINVALDTAFAPRPGVDNLPTRVRYFVRASDPTSFVNTSFTVSANGQTITIPVRITPANLAISLSNTAPALGEAVTLTAPPNVLFTSASTVTVSSGVAVVTGISADSTQLTLLFSPNITDQPLTVSNVAVTYLPGQLFSLPTTGLVTTPVLTQFTSVFDDATPDVNQNVTLTAAGFKFLPGNTFVFFGSDVQTALSFAADSSSVTFRAHKPGASGTISVQGIIISNLPQVPLLLDATTAVTVSNTVLTLPGADAYATAPEVQIPPTGKTGGVVDNGVWFTGPAACSSALGGPCRLYKIVLTTARTFTINASWDNTADVGVYRVNSTGTTLTNIGCDIHGPAPGHFETCTISNLAAGTYFLLVDDFSPFYGPPDNVPPGSITMDLVGG